MIVCWGLGELPGVLDELSSSRPLLVAPNAGATFSYRCTIASTARAHAEIAGIKAAREAAGDADGLIALGGRSAVDTAKAVSSQSAPGKGNPRPAPPDLVLELLEEMW